MGHQQTQDVQTSTEIEVRRGQSLFGTDVWVVDEESKWMAWEGAKNTWLANQRSENTRIAYKTAVRQFFEWAGVPAWQVGSALANEWKTHLIDEDLADTTINAKLAALSSFYSFVLKAYRVPTPDGRDLSLWAGHSNPFSAVKREKVSPYGRATYPTVEELKRMLNAINTDCLRGRRDFALAYTIATTCRRFREVINLQWGDLQEDKDGNYWFKYQAKGGQIKRSVLNKLAYQAICAYLEADGRLETMTADDYVFVAIDPTRVRRLRPDAEIKPNAPISNQTANRILKKLARRADVDEEKAHCHALRHAGLRLEVQTQKQEDGGVDYVQVMELAGHSSLAVTQIYISEVAEDPSDPTGDARARALMPGGRRGKREEPAPEQSELF